MVKYEFKDEDEALRKVKELHRKMIKKKRKYGNVRQQISTNFQGYKVIAVGNALYGGKKWKTFPDFLDYYLKQILGFDWGNFELSKPYDQRHIILQWYDGLCKWQKEQKTDADGIYRAVPTGYTAAWFNLAYDLYVLKHNSSLQQLLINRLKDINQFQGARYELTIAATFIRSGFNLSYEDETDRRKKHPEFIAIHKKTGQTIAVEAKSRHREGVLGQEGVPKNLDELKVGINRLLNNALKKETDLPYIVCFDLNLPPLTGNILESKYIKEVMSTISRREKLYTQKTQFPINLIIITNFPHHYCEIDKPDPRKDFAISPTTNALNPLDYPQIIDDVRCSLHQYGNIPNEFED